MDFGWIFFVVVEVSLIHTIFRPQICFFKGKYSKLWMLMIFLGEIFFAAKMQSVVCMYRLGDCILEAKFIFVNFDVLFFFNLNIFLRSKVQDAMMSAAEIFWGVSKMSKKVHVE